LLHPHHLCGLDHYGDAEEWQQTLGFTWANVDQTIFAGQHPHVFQAVRGRFDRDVVNQVVRTGPRNDELEVISYKDIQYYSWGLDDEIDLARRTKVRYLGRGHRLALIDDCVLWVTWTDGLKVMLDCYEGDQPSLATIEEFQLLVRGLCQLGVYRADLSSATKYVAFGDRIDLLIVKKNKTDDEIQQFRSELCGPPFLEPYQAFATGLGLDDKGYFMAVVLVHADIKAAQQNTQSLEQRLHQATSVSTGEKWIDMIDTVEIEDEGRLTLAKFYKEDITMIYDEEVSFWLMPLLSPT